MFRTFAKFLPNGAADLVQFHPADLTAVLELAWDHRSKRTNVELGDPFHRSDLLDFSSTWIGSNVLAGRPPRADPKDPKALDLNPIVDAIVAACPVLWDHLIYAYMIENTRIYEIFRRVVHAFVHDEKLGVPGTGASQRWLRTTEELFYRDPPSFSITTQTSYVRPSLAATRANAYQRLFGMTLNATDGAKPNFMVAEHANSDFVQVFDELLHEIWQGRSNFANAVGARPTDDAKIADLAEKLHDMLRTRRETGNLSREEFVFVAAMSWFHITVDSGLPIELPIIQDLRAQASSPEERLFKIAQRVGLPAHGLSKSYFDIADSISRILIEIETGAFNTPAAAPALYTPAVGGGGPNEAMLTIIRHWSIITGREMKARRVTPS